MGGQFYWALGDLKFSPAPGGLSQMGGLQSFTLWGGEGGGNKVFSTRGWGESLPHWLKIYSFLTRKSPPSRLTPNFLFPPPMFILPLNNNFHVQYLQIVVFSFEKGLSGQNHSLSDSHHAIEKSS